MSTTLHCRGGIRLAAILLLACVATGAAADEARAPATIDADFAYVTPDATVFATVRVADALASEHVQKLKAVLEKLTEVRGPYALQQLKAFEDAVGMKVTDVERITFVATNLQQEEYWIVVRTKMDIDKDKVLALMRKTEERTAHGKTYLWQKKNDIGFHLVDPRLALVATKRGMQRCLGLPGKEQPRGTLASALALASGDRYHVFATVDIWNALPVEAHAWLTNQIKRGKSDAAAAELLLSVRSITCTGQLGGKLELHASAEFRHPDAARRAMTTVEELQTEVLKELRRTIKEYPEAAVLLAPLAGVKPVRNGNIVTLKVGIDTPVVVGKLLSAAPRVREAATLVAAQNNFKQISIGFHNYATIHDGRFVPAAIRDKNGKPLLSWRVAMLPDLEHTALYRRFKLDEPWDSPHNIKLVEKMPKLYECPHLPAAKPGHTYIQVFTGPGTLFRSHKEDPGFRIDNIPDGASNTILAATAARAVPWTAPDDIVLDKEAIKPKLSIGTKGAVLALFDGSVRTLPKTITEKTLRWAILPDDGNPFDDDWFGDDK